MKNTFDIRGDIAAITLRRNDGSSMETIISAADLPIVSSFHGTWFARWNRPNRSFYVVGNEKQAGGHRGMTRGTVRLHRLIAAAPNGADVDHINHDTLDNRRVNLRVVTRTQNCLNKRTQKNSKSGVPGVCWNKQCRKWHAHIGHQGKKHYLGLFAEFDDAVRAVSEARARFISGVKIDDGEGV